MGGEWKRVQFSDAVWVNPTVPLKRGDTYPFVEMQDVNPSERATRSKQSRLFKGSGSRFTVGDTLMARITPCLENGKTARFISEDDKSFAHGSTEFIVIRGRPGVSDTNFAYYLTRWREVQEFAISQMTGTSGRQRVPTEALSHLTVPLPPIPEQKAIAKILGTLDDKIELNRKTNETLEAMARAVFKSWFVDFLPVRANMARTQTGDPVHAKSKGCQPDLPTEAPTCAAEGAAGRSAQAGGMDAETARLFPSSFEDSEIGRVPKGWKVAILGDVAENPRRGIQPDKILPSTPYIGLEHMPRYCIALCDWGHADELESNKFMFKRDEILFGKLRPYFHKVGVAAVDGVCSTDILVVVPKEPEWFCFVLGHVSSVEFVNHTNAGSTGTKMPRTNWNDMSRYDIALPPKALASVFTERIRPLMERIIFNIHESRTLAALRDALLPKLLSGEIRRRRPRPCSSRRNCSVGTGRNCPPLERCHRVPRAWDIPVVH